MSVSAIRPAAASVLYSNEFSEAKMIHDFSFLLEPPDFSVRGQLTVEALTPLSMVMSMPGKYYRSQPDPSDGMLFGMIENALGWHIGPNDRKQLMKIAQKRFGTGEESRVGFLSLLQHHISVESRALPLMQHFDDLWSQHLHHNDIRHFNGARNYGAEVERLVNAHKAKKSKKKKEDAGIRDNKADQKFYDSIKHALPLYYVSPKLREYVMPRGSYKFILRTTSHLSSLLLEAVSEPAAPAYLGTNDGWVEMEWEKI